MRQITACFCILTSLTLCGCAGTAQMKKLQSRNENLTKQLAAAEDRIGQMEMKVEHLNQVNATLQKEKGVRITETSEVRKEARTFVQQQVGALQEFSHNANLLDYVGGEPIDRSKTDGETLLLVDLGRPFSAPAMITGGRLYAKSSTRAAFCVLRKQGDDLIVIWKSSLFNVPRAGLFNATFETPVSTAKGDYIGLFCPSAVKIPYDLGTGDTRTRRGSVDVGTGMPISSLSDAGQRTYSFGVMGFLE